MNSKKANKPKPLLLLFGDLIAYIYAIFPAVISWALGISFILKFKDSDLLIFLVFLTPIIIIFTFILTCFIFQRLLPKMKPGLYKTDGNINIIVWHLNNALANALDNAGLKTPIYSFHLTKWLYWKAMGANIAFGTLSSSLIVIREYPLITIEKGVSLSGYNHISCHTFEGSRLLLAPINIGENAFIGMNTVIGPKSKIGKNAYIGVDNYIVFDTVADDGRVENFEFEYGSPARKQFPKHIKMEDYSS